MAGKRFVAGSGLMTLLVGLSAGSAPVVAQEGQQATELKAITVIAPRITRTRERDSRMLVTATEKSAQVDYSDLDLTRTADVYKLEERVHEAAKRVCKELADEFPYGEPSAEVCASRARDDAMMLVRQAARDSTGS